MASTSRSKPRQTRGRRTGGATIAMVVLCAFILVILIVAAIQISMMLSTSQMTRNSVEAGALNIATHVPDMKSGSPSSYFRDCADVTGQIGVTNINRVWAKAMLENANAEEMTQSGQAGDSTGNASNAFNAAKDLSQQLQKSVTDQNALQQEYTVKPAGGSGVGSGSSSSTGGTPGSTAGGGQSSAAPTFDSAYVHRGDESNISLDMTQFPPGVNIQLVPVGKGGQQYIPGYKQITINGKTFMLVPFRLGEMPHLISGEEFNSNTGQPPGSSSMLPPNAYHATGAVDGGSTVASAAAVVNPQHQYKMAIPYGYVQIKLEKNQANWKINGAKVTESTYDFQQDDQWEIKSKNVGCGLLNGYASLGNEYQKHDLYSVINALPGDHTSVLNKMLQRLREIDSGMSLSKMVSMLRSQQVNQGTYDYIFYPTYRTADNTQPTIKLSPLKQVSESWFQYNPADGTEKTLATEHAKTDDPNTNRGQVIGKWMLMSHHVDETGKLMWTPGTGVKQSLGMLRIQRTADITFTGKCP